MDNKELKSLKDAAEKYLDANEYDKAATLYENALNFEKEDAEIHFKLGICYKRLKINEKAIDCFLNVIEIMPSSAEAYLNAGAVFHDMLDYDSSIIANEKALQLNPNYAQAYLNLGNSYKFKNNIEKAIDCFEKAVNLDPQYYDAHFNLATTLLLNGNFARGLMEYETRFFRNIKSRPKFLPHHKMWDGSPIKDKTILICFEQGYGDTIQYSRFLLTLKNMGANIIFKTRKPMKKLLEENFPFAQIVEEELNDEELSFDTYAYTMSLPYLLNQNFEDIPLTGGYICANKQKALEYKQKYYNTDKLKIGIKWRGNPTGNRNREVPLEQFYPLSKVENIQLYSLQRSNENDELQNIPEDFNIIDVGQYFNDFSDTAAHIENLDLLICNDNSIAHLGASMGKPVWIMLPYVCEWRWLRDITHSIWYDSVWLFRQDEKRDWATLIDKIKTKLEER